MLQKGKTNVKEYNNARSFKPLRRVKRHGLGEAREGILTEILSRRDVAFYW